MNLPAPRIPTLRQRFRSNSAVAREIALALSEAAHELNLTGSQRRLAEAYVLQGTGNISAAAREANVKNKGTTSTLNLPHVQKYIEILKKHLAPENLQDIELLIYSRQDTLARLTAFAEGLVPTNVRRRYSRMSKASSKPTSGPVLAISDGQPVAQPAPPSAPEPDPIKVHFEEEYDVLGASLGLLKHYEPEEGGGSNKTLIINLNNVPPGALGAGVKAFLAEDAGDTEVQE